jgi:hypothetical protein
MAVANAANWSAKSLILFIGAPYGTRTRVTALKGSLFLNGISHCLQKPCNFSNRIRRVRGGCETAQCFCLQSQKRSHCLIERRQRNIGGNGFRWWWQFRRWSV